MKEYGDYLQDSSVASGLVNQLASVQTQLRAEVSHASTVEGGLHTDIDAERVARM